MANTSNSKTKAKVNKTALKAAVNEYRNQGWSQQRIASHLGYSRSYIRKLLGAGLIAEEEREDQDQVPRSDLTELASEDLPVPELQRVMEAVQMDCRKLVKLEQEEIRNQILEDLQVERRLYLNAIILLGANPIAVVNSSKSRQVQQYISSLQQLSCVIHKNSTALMKIYGIGTSKNMEFGIFNIDYMAAAREAGLDITGCNT